MCGIYGTTIRYDLNQVKDKLRRTSFRGPDKMRYESYDYHNTNVILGHNRLAIIDLDPRSNQPLNYFDQVKIVFNGEIYNFKELKVELIHKGYSFKTESDTEVICAAYLEYGEKCVSKFNGMFAFVIYDLKKQIFYGARDRLGQKPFYYFHEKKQFEFASQISSIQLYNRKLSISNKAIHKYLAWDYVPDTDSIFNEVKKLEAGHYFTFDLNSGVFLSSQYWDIDFRGEKTFSGSYNQAVEHLEALTTKAVKRRLFADVPVGVFLSGGIDSSLIAALATKTTNEKINTFSVKFNEAGFDESIYAQQVAKHIKTNHHIIECNYNEGIDLIEKFSYYYDEPFADPSAIPSMLLSKYTRQHVTVALSGDGGDESFIGYHRYNWTKYINNIYKAPKSLRLFGASILNSIPHYKLKKIASVIKNKDVADAYLSILYNPNSRMFDKPLQNGYKFNELKYLLHNNKNIFERISDFDIKTYLNMDINTKVDRATMAYSLEARAPLMDYTVVDFARSLPTSFKFQNNNQKRILKDILYKHVPKEFFDRPKAGFTMPFKEWFKNELKEFVLEELNEKNLKLIPHIDIHQATKMINEHMNGTSNHYTTIWKILVMKQWLDRNGAGFSIK